MLQRMTRGLLLAAVAGAIFAGAASPAPRIVGGTAIQVQSAPWTVYIEYQAAADSFYDCTGSVIDASLVLTAAHCLYDIDGSGALAQPSQITVAAGLSSVASPSSTDLPQVRSVTALRVHPGYVVTDVADPDDVAVLTLDSPLDLSGPAVRAVGLPTAGAPFPAGAAVAIAGFGRQTATDPPSGQLVSMSATAEPQGMCGDQSADGPVENNAITLCVSAPGLAVCNGDSGSGVVTTGSAPVLVGVVDESEACAPGSPAIAAYAGAPEILRFVQGDDAPPTAPRPTSSTVSRLTWDDPPQVGETLTCSTSGWPEPVQASYSFLNAATGAVLQAGPSSSYLIPATAAGSSIVCQVAVTDEGGTTLEQTLTTSQVEPAPSLRIARLAPLAARRGRTVSVRVVLTVPPGPSRTVSACATPPRAVGGRRCGSRRVSAGSAQHVGFVLKLRIRPAAPLGAARVAISGAVGGATATAALRLRISRA